MKDLSIGFKAFSEPVRLRLLVSLAGKPKNVGTLMEDVGASQPTISHHLGLMRMMWVSCRRNGRGRKSTNN